ncbi:kinase-like domain-containing protein [Butyriboletus roseoflavus]|nr:kinase-like domain-containing protein [Butyriboletus roseoflavus]
MYIYFTLGFTSGTSPATRFFAQPALPKFGIFFWLATCLKTIMDGEDFSGKHVSRYLLSSLLGSGSAGNVYKAVDTTVENSRTFAIKCVRKSRSAQRLRQQIDEIVNHNTVMWCPHVMMLCDFIEEDRYFFLVLPLCEMDMFRAIWQEQVYWKNDGRIKKAFVEVLDGVLAFHKKGVFHRDLKPENIMCNADGMKIDIGDFGLSTKRRLCRDGGRGTTCYMSPECLDEGGVFYHADRADVWSLGVILFNMVTCRYPWVIARLSDKNYMTFYTKKDYLFNTFPISESLNGLLCQIWDPIPTMRLSIPKIREAILGMDTFYKPPHSSYAVSPLSKEVVLADSQQTCVASGVRGDDKKKGTMAPRALCADGRPGQSFSTVLLGLEEVTLT